MYGKTSRANLVKNKIINTVQKPVTGRKAVVNQYCSGAFNVLLSVGHHGGVYRWKIGRIGN